MSYATDCHYVEFRDKSVNGWMYRLELLPRHVAAGTTYYGGANTSFVRFSDNIILTDEIDLESAYSEQPTGIASVPTFKLKLATENMTSDEFTVLVANEAWYATGSEQSNYGWGGSGNPTYDMPITNTWVLRCNYGTGSVSGSSAIMFIGVQRENGGITLSVNKEGQKTVELTIVNALSEFARLYKAEYFGMYLLEHEGGTIRKDDIIYQTIFSGKKNVSENFNNWKACFMTTVDINARILERMQFICGLFRLPTTTIKSIAFSHKHLSFYEQDTTSATGTGTGLSTTINSINYEDDTAGYTTANDSKQEEIWLICATVDDDGDPTDYQILGNGLFIKSSSSGSLFEGETVSDILTNTCIGWGAKQAYMIRDSKAVLSSRGVLGDLAIGSNVDTLTLDTSTDIIGEIKDFATGVPAGVIRSCTVNVDTNGTDDDGEFKYQIQGNLGEKDFSVKCLLHNLPMLVDYKSDWGNSDHSNPDLGSARASLREVSWRVAGYNLRRLWYRASVTGFSSGNADNKMMLRCHTRVLYHTGKAFSTSLYGTYVMDGSHWRGTFLQMQRDSGLPNTIAKFLGIILSNPKRAVLPCTVSMDKLDVNCIGRTVKVTLAGKLSQFSYLHDSGQSYATAVVLEVKSSIMKNTSDVKLLILPQ